MFIIQYCLKGPFIELQHNPPKHLETKVQEELWRQSIFLVEPSNLVQESCSQFHQHFMRSFCANFLQKK